MKKILPISPYLLVLSFLLFGCNLPTTEIGTPNTPPSTTISILPPNFTPEAYFGLPTPDAPHPIPSIDMNPKTYIVQSNDSLGIIAKNFGISLNSILEVNQISDPNILSVGQEINIPPPILGEVGPSYKLIPDSELVDGPKNADFDLTDFIHQYDGQLKIYRQEVDGKSLSGTEIIALVANNYSVNPRLLIAILEYQSQWLSSNSLNLDDLSFPIGLQDPNRSGLYRQLAWAADNLNRGYSLWRSDTLGAFTTADGILNPAHPEINAGTAAVQYFFAQLYDQELWRQILSDAGFIQVYEQLFGNPFGWAIEPLLPIGLTQPTLQLPFEEGVVWNFTGGPHGGWDGGSAWAAIDFAPKMEILGCLPNDAWVVAMADGLIVYANNGMVIQDLDGDGHPQTGWAITYMHISYQDRVEAGAYLLAGDRIGHPSCEGGFSTGTHVHLARRYNGEWIQADGPIPFNMDGWIPEGTGIIYEGVLINGNQVVEACECQEPINAIQR